jgi:hypothetical protein
VVLSVSGPGSYVVRVRYSPYRQPTPAGTCLRPAANGMTEVVTQQAGIVKLNIDTDPSAVAAGAADGAAVTTPAGC